MTDTRGRYRINWVSEQTGIPETTLRAWERRYKVPEPARTPSGYRIYSASDVLKVQRMRELCDSGMAPSDAARAVEEQGDLLDTPDDQLSVATEIVSIDGPNVLVEVRLSLSREGHAPQLVSRRRVLLELGAGLGTGEAEPEQEVGP